MPPPNLKNRLSPKWEPSPTQRQVLGELLQAGSDILRDVFDMEAQGEMSECVHHTMNREEKRALVAAARAEAFTDVVGILEGFAEKK